MKAYITSIGETTVDLSRWSLERQGFDVNIIENSSSLWDKLNYIFFSAKDDFLRVDADVIVNKNVLELVLQDKFSWYQALTYSWFKQDTIHGGIQFIKKECIAPVREHIYEAQFLDRPESYLCRLPEFHNPRTFGTFEKICGLNGFKQNDISRIKGIKMKRNVYNEYDWELAARIERL